MKKQTSALGFVDESSYLVRKANLFFFFLFCTSLVWVSQISTTNGVSTSTKARVYSRATSQETQKQNKADMSGAGGGGAVESGREDKWVRIRVHVMGCTEFVFRGRLVLIVI